jgi:hypothetical protein
MPWLPLLRLPNQTTILLCGSLPAAAAAADGRPTARPFKYNYEVEEARYLQRRKITVVPNGVSAIEFRVCG